MEHHVGLVASVVEYVAGAELAEAVGAVGVGRDPDAGHGVLDDLPEDLGQHLDGLAGPFEASEQRMPALQPFAAGGY